MFISKSDRLLGLLVAFVAIVARFPEGMTLNKCQGLPRGNDPAGRDAGANEVDTY